MTLPASCPFVQCVAATAGSSSSAASDLGLHFPSRVSSASSRRQVQRDVQAKGHAALLDKPAVAPRHRSLASRITFYLASRIAAALCLPARLMAAGWADDRTRRTVSLPLAIPLDCLSAAAGRAGRFAIGPDRGTPVEASREPVEMYLFAYARGVYAIIWPSVIRKSPIAGRCIIKDRGPGEVFAQVGPDFRSTCGTKRRSPVARQPADGAALARRRVGQNFEVPRDQRLNGSLYMSTVRWKCPAREVIPGCRCLSKQARSAGDRRPEYRYSWAWVHFILNGPPEAHEELIHYLADIAKHNPPGQLHQRLERRLPNLDAQIARHFTDWKPQ